MVLCSLNSAVLVSGLWNSSVYVSVILFLVAKSSCSFVSLLSSRVDPIVGFDKYSTSSAPSLCMLIVVFSFLGVGVLEEWDGSNR